MKRIGLVSEQAPARRSGVQQEAEPSCGRGDANARSRPGGCRAGTSDGSGTVALAALASEVDFVAMLIDAQGNAKGVIEYALLFPQLSGFVGGVDMPRGESWFVHWSPDGILTAITTPQKGFARAGENPLGGVVAYVQADTPFAVGYDDELRLLWRVNLPRGLW
jgi:hypothetical protein